MMKNTTSHWRAILLSIGTLSLAGCASPDPRAPDGASNGASNGAPLAADMTAPTFARHGAGTLRASIAEGRPPIYLPYQIEREGDGSAVVTVTKLDRSLLVIRFSQGQATSVAVGDPPQSKTFSSSKQAGLNIIQVGEEGYAIPDHVIYGN